MVNKKETCWYSKSVCKKTSYLIIGLVVFLITAYFLSVEVCAPCSYTYNNRANNMPCIKRCDFQPNWKIILFYITGKNFDYKEMPAITNGQ